MLHHWFHIRWKGLDSDLEGPCNTTHVSSMAAGSKVSGFVLQNLLSMGEMDEIWFFWKKIGKSRKKLTNQNLKSGTKIGQ
jgi:hypothetical protein